MREFLRLNRQNDRTSLKKSGSHRLWPIVVFLLVSQAFWAQCPIGKNTTVCASSSDLIHLNTLLKHVAPSADWFWDGSGASPKGYNAADLVFNPKAAGPGSYRFGYHYYAHDKCDTDGTTYAIINVVPSPNPGIGSHIITCDASGIDADISLSDLLYNEFPGGNWTAHPSNPTGGEFSSILSSFNPDGAKGKYVFTYTVDTDDCPPVSESVYITVQTEELDPGEGSNYNICADANSAINLNSLVTGNDAGGLWSPLAGNPGGGTFTPDGTFDPEGASSTSPNNVYGFSYSFPSNCFTGPSSAVVYITINEPNNPGFDTEISVCMGPPLITLLTELNGSPDVGGTWSANPSAGFGAAGTFDAMAIGVNTGSYEFTYTFLPSQGCGTAQSTLIINVIDQPSVGADGDIYICEGSITPLNLYDVISGEDVGGEWTDGVSVILDPFNVDVSSLPTGMYTYNYSASNLPGCTSMATSTATIIVGGQQPIAGPGGSVTTCNGVVDLSGGGVFITDPGGNWIDNNYLDVDLSDPTMVDFATVSPGIYSFTYQFGANTGCHPDETTVTVIVSDDPPNVGPEITYNVCDDDIKIVELFDLLIGTDPGGVWTEDVANMPPAGMAFVDNGVDISLLPAVTGSGTFVFNYDFGLAQNCTAVGTAVELVVWERLSAGKGSKITTCSGAGVLDLADYISMADPGGFWNISGTYANEGIFDGTAGTFDYTNASAGTYYFVYTQSQFNGSPCPAEESLVTLMIMDEVVQLGADQTIGVCEASTESIDLNTYVQNLGASPGGIFTIAALDPSFDPVTGIFDPTGLSAPTTLVIGHDYPSTCGTTPVTITIEVRTTQTAGVAQNITVCKDYAEDNLIDLLAQLTGEDTGGIWIDDSDTGLDLSDPTMVDVSSLSVGSYAFTYKFFASGECDKNSATVILNCINADPYLGYASNISICEADEAIVNLTSLLSGQQLGGNWVDDLGAGVDLSDPTMVDFGGMAPGSYTFSYTFAPLGTCADPASITVGVTVTEDRYAGEDNYYTICGDLSAMASFPIMTMAGLPGTPDPGGNWTSATNNPPGSVLIFSGGVWQFDPSLAYPGEYNFEYNFTPSGGCDGDKAQVTVFVGPETPVITYAGDPGLVCGDDIQHFDLNTLLTDNSSIGGTWTVFSIPLGSTPNMEGLTGSGTLNAFTGFVHSEDMDLGSYTFEYSFIDTDCAAGSISDIVELIVQPTAVGNDGILTICDHEDILINLESILGILSTPAEAEWKDLDGAGVGLTNPAAVDFSSTPHGTYQFALSIDDEDYGCSPDTAIATVVVSTQPSAGVGGKHEVCTFNALIDEEIIIDLNGLLSGQDPGGVWDGPQPDGDGVFDPATGILTVTEATTVRSYIYTYNFNFTPGSPCADDQAIIKILVTDDCGNTTPCFASQRYNVGSRWKPDGTVDDTVKDGGVVKCGTEATVMTVAAPTESYDSDLFEIDLNGTSYYDPYNGYMMSPPVPQEGEDIIWINFDVRPFVSSFELLVNDDEHLAWALYKSNVPTTGTSLFGPSENADPTIPPMYLSGDCSSLTLVRSGLDNEMWNTIMIDYHEFNTANNYYLAIWDWSDNVNIGDGPDGGIISQLATRMGCEETEWCSAPVISQEPSFIDNKNGTYSMVINVEGINGEYTAIDKTGKAIFVSDNICLTNSSSAKPNTRGSFTLTYPNDVYYKVQIAAIDPSMAPVCGGAENYHYCVSDIIAPPKVDFAVSCDGGYDAGHVYHGFELIPDNSATDVSILASCGSQDIHVTYGDVVRQTGPYLYEVERVYTVFSGCQLPGKEDDQYATCSVFYTVDYSFYRPSEQCDLACNLNGINVGINEQCEAYITPDMILEGPSGDCADDYYVVLTDPETNRAVPNPVNKNYIGKTLQAAVYYIGGNQSDNSCWGYVTIEDKLPPTVYCPAPDTISCNAPDPVINYAAWVHDACACFTIDVLSETVEDYDCDPYSIFAAKKTITYVAIDDSGNRSKACNYEIYYKKEILEIKDFPDDISISCKDASLYDLDGDGGPDPKYTGAPSLGGQPIYPNDGYCKIQASYEDQIIPLCDRSYKILRKWTVLDWCRETTEEANNPIFDYQIIKVEDKYGPEMACYGEDVHMEADPFTCGAKDMKVKMPDILYDCGSGDYRYVIGHKPAKDGEDPYTNVDTTTVYWANGDYWIKEMPYGENWIVCTVYDKCGNWSRCHYKATVVDKVPPIPVCDENTVVSLSTGDKARVWAESFDDGSFDYCSDISLTVKRYEGPECDGTEIPEFREYIDFCCSDIGNENLMVVLRVADEAGNTNTCMVRADVVDKHPAKFHKYPPHQEIYCYQDTALHDMGKPEVKEDACSGYTMDYTDIGHHNQCKIGKITRRWKLWDTRGNEIDSYDQEINIKGSDKPFRMESKHWPKDFNTTVECDEAVTEPDIAGRPLTEYIEGCALLATTFEDEEFEQVDEACFKILRRWTVVDWCQYDETKPVNQNPGIWTYTQKITVNNTEAPVFEESCMTVTDNGITGDCSASVVLTANVSDDCTPTSNLDIAYTIYFEGGTSATGKGSTYSSTSAPFGKHSITWTAMDKCGNTATCTTEFLLEDDKAPTPYCLGEVTTVVMESTGSVEIWAKDFNRDSFDNCPDATLEFALRVSGSEDTLSAAKAFFCNDVGIQELEIWVFDSSGNSDFCRTSLEIQANNACQSASGAMISGFINTENGDPVENVMVELVHSTQSEDYYYETKESGRFEFPNMPMYDDYRLSSTKEDKYLNGVSTLDLVLIQNHILGINEISSPYKIIAADANNSQTVTGSDVIQLRKLILGDYQALPNNTSWRFINANQTFIDEHSPWPFTEEIFLTELSTSEYEQDFMAIKIGDVNGSSQANSLRKEIEKRSYNEQIALTYSSMNVKGGDKVIVPLEVQKSVTVRGIQSTLSYDANAMQFVGIESSTIDIDASNYLDHDEGMVTFSWNTSTGEKGLNEGESLLDLVFIAKHDTELEGLELNSTITSKEAYNEEFEIIELSLERVDDSIIANDNVKLEQNSPNPFTDETVIAFSIPSDSDVILRVYDAAGKQIYKKTNGFSKGQNQVILTQDELKSSGMLYYQLEVGEELLTKKMIHIK